MSRSKQLFLFNQVYPDIPFNVELSQFKPIFKPIQFKLFGAILTKMELFWSSTLSKCTVNKSVVGPSYVGLLRPKGRETMLLFSRLRLSWWFSISFKVGIIIQFSELTKNILCSLKFVKTS
jgi:hypothetical protein